MKKFISYILLLAMCAALFAGCAEQPEPTKPEATPLEKAQTLLTQMYKDAQNSTPADYTVVSSVKAGGQTFEVVWTTDVAENLVKIVKGENNETLIDVNETHPEEVKYVLTATVKDSEGKTLEIKVNHTIPAYVDLSGASYADIVEQAYKLEDGAAMEGTYTLCGTITKVDTAWSPDYKNITVTIAVKDAPAEKTIQCYRLAGDGADKLKEGDEITVQGVLKNYKGTIEFDAGCQLLGMGEIKVIDPKVVVEQAYKLEDGAAMKESVTLTGVITEIDTPWSPDYKNITVIMTVNGADPEKPLMCYRLKGDNAEILAVGDTIEVTGIIKNYKGTIEFDAGCELKSVTRPDADLTGKDQDALIDAAFALIPGQSSTTADLVLTGKIAKIDTPWSADYKNITVSISFEGKEGTIKCYRLTGEGADALAEGDTITVTGKLTNYKGGIQFAQGCTVSNIVKGA